MICVSCREKHGMDKIKTYPNGRIEFLRCDLCNSAFFQSFPKYERKTMPADYRDDWQDVNDYDEKDIRFDKNKPYRF